MRMKVGNIRPGRQPNEVALAVDTIDGEQELVLDKRLVNNDSIDVGKPIAEHDIYYLVGLPAETTSGSSRVWTDKKNVIKVLQASE